MLKDFMDRFLYRFGYIDEKEVVLRNLAPEKKKRLRSIKKQLLESELLGNPSSMLRLTGEMQSILKEVEPKFEKITKDGTIKKDAVRLIGGDVYGYRPAMARLYSLFQNNPLAIYAFIARHHWAVRSCLQVIRDELNNDGYQLRAAKGTSKKRVREVYRQLKEMKIFDLRIDIACHIKLFGNAWLLPHKNLLGAPGVLELLAPPKLMPIIDPITDQIIGWEYTVGRTTTAYPLDKVYQLWEYTVDNYKHIGDPCLMPAILAIEADLSADSFNNQMFQSGGLMGIILNMKTDPENPLDRDEIDIVDELQDRIDAMYSGVKAAHRVMVTNNVEKLYDVNPVGKLDKSFQTLHSETAKTVAQCLGVPPEKIAISRSSNLQYIPSLVEDSVNASFDKSLNALINLVDDFLNERILRDLLGITDVRIVASGRYGALTKNAADTINSIAQAGPLITVNQALDRILGWEALPPDNPRGNMVLDNSVGRDPTMVPLRTDLPEEDFNLDNPKTPSNKLKKLYDSYQKGLLKKVTENDAEESPVDLAIIKRGYISYYLEQ